MAVVINASKLRAHANNAGSDKYAHLKEEQEALQRELTTSFPKKENILFDKDLGYLMLDG